MFVKVQPLPATPAKKLESESVVVSDRRDTFP
jgi:hypothetical protein